jgi:hypothetical protein
MERVFGNPKLPFLAPKRFLLYALLNVLAVPLWLLCAMTVVWAWLVIAASNISSKRLIFMRF